MVPYAGVCACVCGMCEIPLYCGIVCDSVWCMHVCVSVVLFSVHRLMCVCVWHVCMCLCVILKIFGFVRVGMCRGMCTVCGVWYLSAGVRLVWVCRNVNIRRRY